MNSTTTYCHSITDKDKITFDIDAYSNFKYGCLSATEQFGSELFNHIVRNNTLNKHNPYIIYSSPYDTIPTASLLLTKIVIQKLLEDGYNNITEGKLNRLNTYSANYSAMSASERYQLISNDTYSFEEIPDPSAELVFIDDISITGTHERIITELIANHKLSNKKQFIYFAKLNNKDINPNIENYLNNKHIDDIDKLANLINEGNYKFTTRAIKFILIQPISSLERFIQALKESNCVETIYFMALSNKYNEISDYSPGLNYLKNTVLVNNC